MRARISKQLPLVVAIGALGSSLGLAQSRAPEPQPYALRGVQLSPDAEVTHTLILRGGQVEAVLDGEAEPPAGCRHVDGAGLLALPAFVDAFTDTGCETPEPVIDMDRPVPVNESVRIDMRQANRKGIQPSFAAVDVLDLGEAGAESHRESGFGLLLSAPTGQTLSGKSVLATTHDAAVRDIVVRGEVFQHGAFRATGSGYPNTLMGFHAQLRQLFYDADRHTELQARFERNPGGPRPNFDHDLEAGAELLAGERRLVCAADSARNIRRWMRLAEELGLRIAISGGREAWKCAEELAERDVPVFLTLDWGEEVDDPDGDEKEEDEEDEEDDEPEAADDDEDTAEGEADAGSEEDEEEGEEVAEEGEEEEDGEGRWIYEEPVEIRRERRRLWEEGRDCALRLAESDVRFAFGTGGDKPKDLLKRVRTLVEEGMERDRALAALTTSPAELLGVGSGFGELAPGRSASVALWTADPLTEKKAKVAWLFVDGFAYDFDVEIDDEESAGDGEGPAEGVDLTGSWTMEGEGEQEGESTLELEMDAEGNLTGTIEFDMGGNKRKESIVGTVSGMEVDMTVSLSVEGVDISAKFWGEIEDDIVEGDMTIVFEGGEQEIPFTMERVPERADDTQRKGGL